VADVHGNLRAAFEERGYEVATANGNRGQVRVALHDGQTEAGELRAITAGVVEEEPRGPCVTTESVGGQDDVGTVVSVRRRSCRSLDPRLFVREPNPGLGELSPAGGDGAPVVARRPLPDIYAGRRSWRRYRSPSRRRESADASASATADSTSSWSSYSPAPDRVTDVSVLASASLCSSQAVCETAPTTESTVLGKRTTPRDVRGPFSRAGTYR